MKEKEDDFIGKKGTTPKGGIITVKEGYHKNRYIKYICKCSICSKDEELWPYGSIQSQRSTLVNGNVSCGCGNNPRWKEWQNKIRVQRECEERGYIFHGWSGEYNGVNTYIDLENLKTGNRWCTTNIYHFLKGVGDPVQGMLNNKKATAIPDEDHIRDFFYTGNFHKDTKFYRSTKNNKDGYWDYICPICSKDEYVLHGLCDGIFTSRMSGLKRGMKSCRFSKNYQWTENQNIHRVKSICAVRGYIYHGWAGDYKNSNTKLDLENPSTCNRWRTTTINDLLNGTGDPVEGRLRTTAASTLPDELHIKRFNDAGFSDEYKFWRDTESTEGSSWNYTCPYCSTDEYVVNGLCNGIFKNVSYRLKKGNKSCRCSNKFRWTQEQREYQINKICKEEGLTFKGWESKDGYKNYKSKFAWYCQHNHLNCTSVDNFLRGNERCRVCYKERSKQGGKFYGYYPERKDEKDFLYVINFDNLFIKVGRSFDIKERVRKLSSSSGIDRNNIVIIRVFTSDHKTVYDTEQWLHEELRERGFEYNEEDGLWSIELFSLDCISVLEYLLNHTTLSLHSD